VDFTGSENVNEAHCKKHYERIKINMLNIIDRPEKYFTFGVA
jgi:hypothetical protein